MELNAPLVVGGLVAWYVSTRSKDAAVNKARLDRGTLIASGFIAGGALMGVVSAVLKFAGADWYFGAVGVVERRRMVGACDVCGPDRLYGLAHDACEARTGVIHL